MAIVASVATEAEEPDLIVVCGPGRDRNVFARHPRVRRVQTLDEAVALFGSRW